MRKLFDLNVKFTFSAFVDDMNSKYEEVGCTGKQFMSRPLFNCVCFSYMARLHIDFRTEIDPFCQHHPEALACDGTHIGPPLRNLKLQSVETTDDRIIVSKHQRYHRTFVMGYGPKQSKARKCLKFIGDNYFSKLDATDIGTVEDLCMLLEPKWQELISLFMTNSLDDKLSSRLAELFQILSRDAALLTVMPYNDIPNIKEMLNRVKSRTHTPSIFVDIAGICGPEIANVIQAAVNTEHLDIVVECLHHLHEQVLYVHEDDVQTYPVEIETSYNPSMGTALYFNKNGNQVRSIAKYQLKFEEEKKKIVSSQQEQCTKRYPQISRGGFAHVFIWMCPLIARTFIWISCNRWK